MFNIFLLFFFRVISLKSFAFNNIVYDFHLLSLSAATRVSLWTRSSLKALSSFKLSIK